ncbi:DUF2336 domain-containing protein [Microvirga massiliensis]|uniref:DUF2336 domain-containing protein n=1 Tax=Microvirga massiliensis TaxID=1033741 RepID=UPI00065F8C6C|nr:DUF2336 domain-containing protein [Microvirga massiliensis]
MASVDDLLEDLEHAIGQGNGARRETTLHRVTGLLLGDIDVLTDEQIDIFDVVLVRLTRAIEARARAELARRLAPIPRAPIELVRTLVHDEIDVARPLLELSQRLTDSDLIGVAISKGAEHMRVIAGRHRLSAPVSDVLATRGDLPVLQTLAANRTARISPRGAAILIEQAFGDGDLRGLLAQRADLPGAQVLRLFDLAHAGAWRNLAPAVPADKQVLLEQALERSTRRLRAIIAGTLDYSDALDTIGAIELGRPIDEADVRGFAQAVRAEETICAIASCARLPLDAVERLFSVPGSQLLLVVARAMNWSFDTLEALLDLQNPDAMRPHLRKQTADRYSDLSRETAEAVMTFLRRDGTVAPPPTARNRMSPGGQPVPPYPQDPARLVRFNRTPNG